MVYNNALLHPLHEAIHSVRFNKLSTVMWKKSQFFMSVTNNNVTKLHTGNDCRSFHCDHAAVIPF